MRSAVCIIITASLSLLTGCGDTDGTPDATAEDAALGDASVMDAAAVDAALVDAGLIDAGSLDATVADAAVADAAVADAAVVDAEPDAGCVETTTRACPMASDTGECRAGTQLCSGGAWLACEGRVEPTTEVCDGADNNCDGAVDEGCCGNGVADALETCDTAITSGEDGACPDSCDDEIECTTDETVGADCQAECTNTVTDFCRSGDVSIEIGGTRSCTSSGPPNLSYDGEVELTLTPEAGGVRATGSCTVWPESIGPGTASSAVIGFNRVLSAPDYTATATRSVDGGEFRCVVRLSGSSISARWEWDFSRCCTYRCSGSATGSTSSPPLLEP